MAITTSNLSGVVINEVGTSPSTGDLDLNGSGATNSGDEFIEFYNTSGSSVDISGWQVWDLSAFALADAATGMVHSFAPGTILGAGERIVVADAEGGTGGALGIPNAVYMQPGASGALGTPTFMSLTDGDMIILYNPNTDEYVQFAGEDADAADQAVVDTYFGGSTLIGTIERGLEDNTGNSAQRQTDGDDTWIDAPQTPGAANCFLTGTLIAQSSGEIPVEALRGGDEILGANGEFLTVKWIGRQTVSTRFGPADRLRPVRFAIGSLGNGLPHSELTVTADHAMLVDGVLCNASTLVNGATITRAPLAEMGESYTVYHIETEAHEIILANGAATETYIDHTSRRAFDNYAEYEALYGDETAMQELPIPRISSARQLPVAIRNMLNKKGAA